MVSLRSGGARPARNARTGPGRGRRRTTAAARSHSRRGSRPVDGHRRRRGRDCRRGSSLTPRDAGAAGHAPVSAPRPARVVDAEAGPRVPRARGSSGSSRSRARERARRHVGRRGTVLDRGTLTASCWRRTLRFREPRAERLPGTSKQAWSTVPSGATSNGRALEGPLSRGSRSPGQSRSAISGSTRDARHAGSAQAISVTMQMTRGTLENVTRSKRDTRNSSASR